MPPPHRRVLGVDPGLATTGWGVLEEDRDGTRIQGCGAIATLSSQALPQRLSLLHQQLQQIIQKFAPDTLAIEEFFFAKFVRTTLSSAQARGVVLLVASESRLAVAEYNPRAVKIAVTGYGSASKSQMQSMVQRLCGLPHPPAPDDVADALAIALCHLQTKRLLALA